MFALLIMMALRVFESPPNLDRSVVIGGSLAFVLLGLGILLAGGKVLSFIDPASFMIVIGGTVGATFIHFSIADVRYAWEQIKQVLSSHSPDAHNRIVYLVRLGQKVRSDGLLVLDREARMCPDPFLRNALELTVDGQKQADVKHILENEMRTSTDRALRAIHVLDTMGGYAPALGLIGTLIGLIQMLGSLQNPASVGPAMAVALVTTFYGAILANLICLPLAGKLRVRHQEETLTKSITIEGVMCLGSQENPIVIEQKLASFLPVAA